MLGMLFSQAQLTSENQGFRSAVFISIHCLYQYIAYINTLFISMHCLYQCIVYFNILFTSMHYLVLLSFALLYKDLAPVTLTKSLNCFLEVTYAYFRFIMKKCEKEQTRTMHCTILTLTPTLPRAVSLFCTVPY